MDKGICMSKKTTQRKSKLYLHLNCMQTTFGSTSELQLSRGNHSAYYFKYMHDRPNLFQTLYISNMYSLEGYQILHNWHTKFEKQNPVSLMCIFVNINFCNSLSANIHLLLNCILKKTLIQYQMHIYMV